MSDRLQLSRMVTVLCGVRSRLLAATGDAARLRDAVDALIADIDARSPEVTDGALLQRAEHLVAAWHLLPKASDGASGHALH